MEERVEVTKFNSRPVIFGVQHDQVQRIGDGAGGKPILRKRAIF